MKDIKMQTQYKGWKQQLQAIIDANNRFRDKSKLIASAKTQSDRAKLLFLFFNLLRKGGFAVDPPNIKPKHIQLFCNYLTGKGADKKVRSAATIQSYLSILKTFCTWVGKDDMIGNIEQYFEDPSITKRTYAAVKDKGFKARGIDIHDILNTMWHDEPYVCMQLLAQSAFGLRCQEALAMRPAIHFVEDNLHVVDGTKNGKPRIVPIENDYQHAVEKTLKAFIGKVAFSLMDPRKSLLQNMSKYYRVTKKYGITKKELGVTGHGLRADFVNDFMMDKGLIPLIRGGEIGALPKDQELEIRLQASQRLGHNRVGITTAYSGAFTETGKMRAEKASQQPTKSPKEADEDGDDEPEAELIE